MAFLDENGVGQLWAAVKDRLAGAFDNVEFDVAEQAANLVSGDSIATAFGKLAKNYTSLLTSISDLNTNLTSQINTKLNKSDVLANYTTTATGKALDASLGPAIKAKMDLADTLNTQLTTFKNNIKIYSVLTDGAVSVNFNASTAYIPGLTLTLDPGTYVLMANVYFQGCDPGRQGITITFNNSPGSSSAYAYDMRAHSDSYPYYIYYNLCNIERIASKTTLYLMGHDQRKTAVTCAGKLCAVRLI